MIIVNILMSFFYWMLFLYIYHESTADKEILYCYIDFWVFWRGCVQLSGQSRPCQGSLAVLGCASAFNQRSLPRVEVLFGASSARVLYCLEYFCLSGRPAAPVHQNHKFYLFTSEIFFFFFQIFLLNFCHLFLDYENEMYIVNGVSLSFPALVTSVNLKTFKLELVFSFLPQN